MSSLIAPPPVPQPDEPLYVFAYGSLLWNPEFPYSAEYPTRLDGWHRRFCIKSTLYRGTPRQPGLVLGLDKGGSCTGIIYRIEPADANMTLQYLWSREMHSGIYDPRWLSMPAADGTVKACAFTVRRDHPNYVHIEKPEELAEIIRNAKGQRGHNLDYLANTVAELEKRGLADEALAGLLDLARRL